jgi:hypothetical protein
VVCDYSVVLNGSKTVTPAQQFNTKFNTGGRRPNGEALLVFNLRSLGEIGDVDVEVNQLVVGKLRNYHNEDARNWHSQNVIFPASRLKDGDNSIEITVPSGDIVLSDIVCFFEQSA